MFSRNDYSTAFDFEQDRDLIAQMNETSDPRQLDSLAGTARLRLRDRSRQTAQPERQRRFSGRRLMFPRTLIRH